MQKSVVFKKRFHNSKPFNDDNNKTSQYSKRHRWSPSIGELPYWPIYWGITVGNISKVWTHT